MTADNTTLTVTPDDIVNFWRDAGQTKWFTKDAAFDEIFRDRFLDAHFAAARRELDGWCATATGALAVLLLLDQFPRNCFRGTGHMFATDSLARTLANSALEKGHDLDVESGLRVFFYLPFTHSEDLADQERGVELNQELGGLTLHHAEEHRDIIRDFGRFPHRNHVLGRETTPEEKAFLDAGGFSG